MTSSVQVLPISILRREDTFPAAARYLIGQECGVSYNPSQGEINAYAAQLQNENNAGGRGTPIIADSRTFARVQQSFSENVWLYGPDPKCKLPEPKPIVVTHEVQCPIAEPQPAPVVVAPVPMHNPKPKSVAKPAPKPVSAPALPQKPVVEDVVLP